MRRLRLGFLRVAQETNAHSRVLTTLDDFDRTHFFEGAALLAACEPSGMEAPGFLRNAELSGLVSGVREVAGDRIALVPLFSSWAIPGGPVDEPTLSSLRARIRSSLRAAGPLDGVFFSLHGAMGAVGVDDPEALFVADVRAEVGSSVPVAVTLDLHAQVTRALIDQVDILAGYRTNPHRDHARTGRRAGRVLARTLLGEVKPVLAWRALPLVMGGGTTLDFAPTMRPLFRHMTRIERDERVLYASLFTCHLWHDSPDLGWSAVVMTNGDAALAEAHADGLAERAWAVRDKQPPVFPKVEEAIRRARRARLRRQLGTVCMCDASDIVGAGAAGENTRLLAALLDAGRDLVSYVPIRGPAAVRALQEVPVGASAVVHLGGDVDPESPPLTVRGVLTAREDHATFGRMVVVRVHRTHVVITERVPLAMRPDFFSHVGLSAWRADVVVVKSLFPFRLYFLLQNRRTLYVRTEGATDLDRVKGLTFNDPVHPLQRVTDWRPADRRRRGLVTASSSG